ncbi:endolytic transglycosylase MltG [Oleisolibacter albus]|uniref:endolytic transglycosylase MltG n=1 Tax=Oleisolibacter albus TaxID=2171757 RepID=UPI000DF29785|nr:endolytic transglycosylase MltG [Oleisolibacter albus]
MSTDKADPPVKRRRWVLPAAAFLLLLLALAGGGAWYGWQRYTGPGPLAADSQLVIARGSGVQAIARQLAGAGVVRSPYDLMLAAKLRESAQRLKAGEYAFTAGMSVQSVLDLLESGKTVVRRVTVPEGLTSRQILVLLEGEPGLAGTVDPVPADGTLLPETYHYSWGDSRAEIVARMQEAMRKALAELWPGRAAGLPVTTPEQAVTLASIIEKETAVASERPRVAGVFANRLRLGMKLQSDPTIIYALTGGKGPLDRPLTRADWKLDSPYNTYVADGLPPGPIANPGLASLKATLNPEAHKFLYFVADGSGGHAFAETLEAHNRNVAAWRKIRDEQGETAAQ